MLRRHASFIAALALLAGTSAALAQVGNTITYQGQLKDTGLPRTTPVDMEFRIFDTPTGGTGTQIGLLVTRNNVTPADGLFTADLDFGVDPYTADAARYLEIRVSNAGAGTFTTLPRQRLTAAPFSRATRGINVDSAGRVGIGTTATSTAGLTVIGAAGTVHTSGFFGDNTNSALRITHPSSQTVAIGGNTNHVLQLGGFANDNSSFSPLMTLNTNGNVGIGTTTTPYKMNIRGTGFATLDQPIYGAETDGGQFGPQVRLKHNGPSGRDWAIVSGGSGNAGIGAGNFGLINLGASSPAVVVQPNGGHILLNGAGTGNVGIGTTNPTTAKLEVRGNATGSLSAGQYFNQAGGLFSFGVGAYQISIYGENNVAGGAFLAFSDARIKQIQGRSDAAHDLETLLGLEVTDYTFKDTVAKGTRPNKKVIAQQVDKIYPQAVSTSTDVVPDIYKQATTADGWITLATDLKVGDKVRLIGEKEEGIHEVLEVREGGSAFRTDFKPATDKVFVYGRQVNDFMNVDYEAIAMLNVSATQQLARQNAEMRTQIRALQDQLTLLKAQTAALLDARNEKFGGAREALLAAQTVGGQ